MSSERLLKIWEKPDMRIYFTELKKMLIDNRGLIILLILALLWGAWLYPVRVYDHIYDEDVYKNELKKYEGEYSESKKNQILERYEEINDILSRYYEVKTAYETGDLTLEEYREYNDKYRLADSQLTTYEYLVKKCEYYDSYAAEGKCFFFETDIEDFLSSIKYNYVIFIGLLVCIIAVYSKEFQDETVKIILTCKNGRLHTYVCKLLSLLFVTVLFSGLIYCMTYAAFVNRFGDAGLDQAVHNIIGYNQYSRMSIRDYFMSNVTLSVCAWCVGSVFISMILLLTRKVILSVFIAFLFCLLPALTQGILPEWTCYLVSAKYLASFFHETISLKLLMLSMGIRITCWSILGYRGWIKN